MHPAHDKNIDFNEHKETQDRCKVTTWQKIMRAEHRSYFFNFFLIISEMIQSQKLIFFRVFEIE